MPLTDRAGQGSFSTSSVLNIYKVNQLFKSGEALQVDETSQSLYVTKAIFDLHSEPWVNSASASADAVEEEDVRI